MISRPPDAEIIFLRLGHEWERIRVELAATVDILLLSWSFRPRRSARPHRLEA